MKRERSQSLFKRALELMPGGVNSPARAFGGVGGEPVYIARGQGAYLWDVDGNQYIDYVGSWGPLILGHAFPAVVAAVEVATKRGTSFGAPTEAESELAELIIEAIPSVQKVRLVNSGTEATMSAIRLARGFTGRDIIIKFAGNYHGHVDALLVAAGSSAATLAVPNSPGVTAGTTRDTLVLQYNNVAGLETAFQEHGPRIAGVIFEPVVGNMGVVPPSREFLKALRGLTREHGALLICDEVMTGFRVAYGGAQQLLGIEPDLTTLGKIVGGGLPVGAYGGRAEIMNHVLPAGKVFQAGTLSGNPLATAAGCAMLRSLRNDPPYDRIEHLSARMERGVRNAATRTNVPHQFARVGSMMTLFFARDPVSDWPTASRCDTAKFAKWFWAMLDLGIYFPCSQFEALFVSAAHSEADIDATTAAAEQAFAIL
jgi:glutamate-1-semialdehyde 2,1-aminomutase